jgi:hypothetical protein
MNSDFKPQSKKEAKDLAKVFLSTYKKKKKVKK